jgi:Lon protease-like protein
MTSMAPAALSEDELRALSIFPLPNAALFPGALLPLHVFEQRYRDLVADALAGSGALAIAQLEPGFEGDYEGRPPVHEICGAGRIVEHVVREGGRYDILVYGLARVRIRAELPPAARYRVVRAEVMHDLPVDPRLASALEVKIRDLWTKLGPRLPAPVRDLGELMRGVEGAGGFADRLAALMRSDGETAQSLLDEQDPCERLRLIATQLDALVESLSGAGPPGSSRWN